MKKIKIALAGNPNAGKTSIFNALTGTHQKVGNWPGVTVEKKEGFFKYENFEIEVVDLPGIYSLSASSIDEKIARDYLINENPDVVVCVLDSSNIERNLFLVVELVEMGLNVVIDLNMIDLAEDEGIHIDDHRLSLIFGKPVVKTIANKGVGIEDLKRAIVLAYLSKSESPCESCPFSSLCPYNKKCQFLSENKLDISYSKNVEKGIEQIETFLRERGVKDKTRWLSIKLLEGDEDIIEWVKEKYGAKEVEKFAGNLREKIEKEIEEDVLEHIIETKYSFIRGILLESVSKKGKRKATRELSDKIDRVVMNRILGIPIFLLIMYLVFKLVFAAGSPLADLIDQFFGYLGDLIVENFGKDSLLVSFIVDGVIGGIGSVIVFLPNIMILFFIISLLEDTGYMARAAFVVDKIMHSFGLHGKSFIPMILGFGCNVPAIMATRTLESEKDRILTILAIPFMSCSARLPIYILFSSVFFHGREDLVVFSLYAGGIVVGVLTAVLFKSLFFKEEVAPLIMELPPYRLPSVKNSLKEMWLRSKLFLTKAGTIIFGTVILVWLLSSLPPGVEYASKESIIGRIGELFAPIFAPAGFGFWQASVALIFGILAKEVVVGTLGTLLGDPLQKMLVNYFTPLSALSFMVMSLLYIPCIATVATIKREANWKWALVSVVYTILVGWTFSTLIYQAGKLMGFF